MVVHLVPSSHLREIECHLPSANFLLVILKVFPGQTLE
jgi:hypothetical protein